MSMTIDIAEKLPDALIAGAISGIALLYMSEAPATALAGAGVVGCCAMLPTLWRAWHISRETSRSHQRLSAITPDWQHSLGLLKVRLEGEVVDWQTDAFGGAARGYSALLENREDALRQARALAPLEMTAVEKRLLFARLVPFWQFERQAHDPALKQQLQDRLEATLLRTMSRALFRALIAEDKLLINAAVWTDAGTI